MQESNNHYPSYDLIGNISFNFFKINLNYVVNDQAHEEMQH
jgi:hypothetical protein